jgi:hypothetical protein
MGRSGLTGGVRAEDWKRRIAGRIFAESSQYESFGQKAKDSASYWKKGHEHSGRS